MLEIIPFVLGMVQTNTYLLADDANKEAIVIDPADDGAAIVKTALERQWKIQAIWITHAHFDHIGGVATLIKALEYSIPIGLHPDDIPLWKMQGGAGLFGLELEIGLEPDLLFYSRQVLKLGNNFIEVRHTPGHTPGHVVFYNSQEGVCFCGDVIFQGSIGRTDLLGGDHQQLLSSIQENIMTLPDSTRLLPGHGPETTVLRERAENLFL